MTNKNELSFKEQLIDLVTKMKGDNFNFQEDVPVFKWIFDEFPELTFELAIYSKEAIENEEAEQMDLEFEGGTLQ